MPQTTNDPGNQNCRIEDINILCSSGGAFAAGLHLSNTWKSFVSNVRMLGPTVITGTSLLALDGFSIDNRFNDCYAEAVAIQFMSGVGANNTVNIRLVSVTNFPTLATSNVVIDNSGNTLNQAIWLTGLTGTARLGYLH